MMDDGYQLHGTEAKGEGVFATRPFHIGETVMIGVIDRELDRNQSHASQVSAERFVLHGGLVPKVNHSCDPNCGIRLNSSGAHDFVAREPIVAGLEITFDYAMRNFTVEHFAAHCLCGSRHCRDRITGWKDLPAQRKADYHGSVAPYLTDIDSQRTKPVIPRNAVLAPLTSPRSERATPPTCCSTAAGRSSSSTAAGRGGHSAAITSGMPHFVTRPGPTLALGAVIGHDLYARGAVL
jgi:hypothetical protein